MFFFLMIRRPPRSTRTDTLFPYSTLFRSRAAGGDGWFGWLAVIPPPACGRGMSWDGQNPCLYPARLIFAVLYPILALADRAPLARFFQRVMSDRLGLSDAHGGLAHPSPLATVCFRRLTFFVDPEEHIP